MDPTNFVVCGATSRLTLVLNYMLLRMRPGVLIRSRYTAVKVS